MADEWGKPAQTSEAAEQSTHSPGEEETEFTQQPHDSQTTQPETAELPDLDRIGHYTNLRLIGRGGMGVVYRAKDSMLKRDVAVKMMAVLHASSEEVDRFRREAEAAAQLDHPGIVPVFETGDVKGRPYFSMALIEGQSLADLLRDEPLPPRRAAELVRDVTKAIAYAHQQGVIHRDIKPGNILLDAEGKPHVTDFGIARRLEVDSVLTATGDVLGTPSYMPPEQASGIVKTIGPASDVYSLGAVLYHTLTGTPPFTGPPAETITNVLLNEPVPPRRLNSGIPKDLETICLKCLEKQPKKRYASAADLRDELECFLANEPIVARPIGRVARLGRWAKRQPAVAGLSALLLLAVVVGIAAVLFQWQKAEDNRERAENLADVADEEKGKAIEAADKAKTAQARAEARERQTAELLYEAYLRLAADAQKRGDYLLARDYLQRMIPGEKERDLRTFAWHYLWRNRRIQTETRLPAVTYQIREGASSFPVAVSADAKLIAVPVADAIQVSEIATGRLKQRIPFPASVTQIAAIAFSPDSTLLAFSGGKPRRRTLGNAERRIWSLKKKEYRRTLVGKQFFWPRLLKFSPDGQRLLGVSGRPAFEIWDVNNGQSLRGGEFKLPSRNIKRVVSVMGPDKKWRVTHQDQPRSTLDTASIAANFDKTRATVVFADDYEAFRWNLMADDGPERILESQLPRPIVDNKRPAQGVGLSQDGKLIAVQQKEGVEIWDAFGLKLVTTLAKADRDADVAGDLVFSPDGNTLVGKVRGKLGELLLWRLTDGTFRGRLLGLDGEPVAIRFAGNSNLIVATETGHVTSWEMTDGSQVVTENALLGKELYRVFQNKSGAMHATGLDPKDKEPLTLWTADGGLIGKGPAHKSPQHVKLWNVGDFHLSTDGRYTVAWGEEPEVFSLVQGKAILKLPAVEGHTYKATVLSDDGSLLASQLVPKKYPEDLPQADYYKHHKIEIRDVESGKVLTTLKPTTKTSTICTSPAGNRVAVARHDGTVLVWERKTNEWTELRAGSALSRPHAFSPDGRFLACIENRNQLRIWNLQTGKQQSRVSLGKAFVVMLIFSHDSRSLLAVKGAGKEVELGLIDPVTGQQRIDIALPNDVVKKLAFFATFSRSGKQVLLPLTDGRVLKW